MPNPNIVNVSVIRGHTAYCIPTTTGNTVNWTFDGTTALTGLTPAASNVHRITSLTAANFSNGACNVTVSIGNNPTFGSSTNTNHIASNISVPSYSTLVVIDKTNSIYLTENQSVGLVTSNANSVSFVATFEMIT